MLVRIKDNGHEYNAKLDLLDENGNDITSNQFTLRSSLMLDFMKFAPNTDGYEITYNTLDKKIEMSTAAYLWFRDRLEEIQASIDWDRENMHLKNMFA